MEEPSLLLWYSRKMILWKYKAWLWYILELYKTDLRYQEQVQLLWKICEGDVENSAKYEKRNSEIQKKRTSWKLEDCTGTSEEKCQISFARAVIFKNGSHDKSPYYLLAYFSSPACVFYWCLLGYETSKTDLKLLTQSGVVHKAQEHLFFNRYWVNLGLSRQQQSFDKSIFL